MSGTKKNLPTFEAKMAELEQIVQQLEQGDLSLEEALKTYEKGTQLSRECQIALETAQQRVDLLLEKGKDLTRQSFTTSMESSVSDDEDNQ